MSAEPSDDPIVELLAAVAWWASLADGQRIYWVSLTDSENPLLNWFAFKRSKADERMQALLENHGSIYLLKPLSDSARDWLRNTAPDEAQFWSDALVIEPRYVRGVIEAFEEAGGDVVR